MFVALRFTKLSCITGGFGVKPPFLLTALLHNTEFVKKPECSGAELIYIFLTSFKELESTKEEFVNKPEDARELCDCEFSKHMLVTF
jgi:hypothetical protein